MTTRRSAPIIAGTMTRGIHKTQDLNLGDHYYDLDSLNDYSSSEKPDICSYRELGRYIPGFGRKVSLAYGGCR